MRIQVKVIPGASKDQIVEYRDNILKVKVASPPQDGKANKRLINFLSKVFNIKKKDINIVKGEKSRNKLLDININEKLFFDIISQK